MPAAAPFALMKPTLAQLCDKRGQPQLGLPLSRSSPPPPIPVSVSTPARCSPLSINQPGTTMEEAAASSPGPSASPRGDARPGGELPGHDQDLVPRRGSRDERHVWYNLARSSPKSKVGGCCCTQCALARTESKYKYDGHRAGHLRAQVRSYTTFWVCKWVLYIVILGEQLSKQLRKWACKLHFLGAQL